MKKISIDEIILQIIFFAAGIYILIRIFIPIINPASMATNSDYSGKSFYVEILNKANSTIDIASINNNENASGILSVLFTYLTGIDLSNPETYIASQLPMLQFIDITSLDSKEQEPVVVIPRETDNTNNNSKKAPIADNNKQTSPNKKTSNDKGAISKVNPNNIEVSKKKLISSKPVVFIFHTHTTETYNPSKLPNKSFSTDLSTTVAKVGDSLDYELENTYGISTIHDSTIHDIPLRADAYKKARPTVEKYIKKYPGLKLIIDLHRDGTVNRNIETALINKADYARIMFVAGTKFKAHDKNNKTTQKLNNELNYLYPGFSRGIDYKNSIYNQDLSPNMVLIEVGSDENSLDEAIKTTKVLAKVIANYLK